MKKWRSCMKWGIDKEKLNLKTIGMDKLIIIVVCGIVLLICSFDSCGDEEKNTANNEITYEYDMKEYEKQMEARLEKLLENMEGVGEVQVMVTVKTTTEKVVLTEYPYSKSISSESDSEGGQKNSEEEEKDSNTVYVTNKNGDTVPYVINEIMPEIEGVAIIAEGGDSLAVKEKIIAVVKSLFDVESNKISIGKMK